MKELTLKEHQNVMLNMMIEFDRFCTCHGLKYFLAYGTLLGAIRHNGFIPWDDDVDFLMPREDYNKLLEYKKISDYIKIVSVDNNQGYYHPFTYCNIIDNRTIMKESLIKKSTGKGVFCDIFPLDGLPKNFLKRKLVILHQMIMQNLLYLSLNKNEKFIGMKRQIKIFVEKIMSNKDLELYAKKIDLDARKYNYNLSNSVIPLTSLFNMPNNLIADRSEYNDFILVDFEGYPMRVPIGYDSILHRAYGDYMQLPPEEDRKGHHEIKIYYK